MEKTTKVIGLGASVITIFIFVTGLSSLQQLKTWFGSLSSSEPDPVEVPMQGEQGASPSESGRRDDLTEFVLSRVARVEASSVTSTVGLPQYALDKMTSRVLLDGCSLTVVQEFRNEYMESGRRYFLELGKLSPESVSEIAAYSRTWTAIPGDPEIPLEYSVGGLRMLTRNLAREIASDERKKIHSGNRGMLDNSGDWTERYPQNEVFVAVRDIEAPRVAKAMVELIELCGGSSELY